MESITKVSIIIPVYNCQQYLEQCFSSVLDQTLKDLEIICIDDGSVDQSAEIIRRMASLDSRITLLQQDNQGPGTARNLGMRRAKGKYIAFLDADDFYWDSGGLEQLYNTCESKKVAACASLQWCVNGCVERLESFKKGFGEDRISHYYDHQMDYYFTSYLFLRSMLIEKGIYFPPYIRFEDPPFLARALYEADRFAVADTCLYYYRRPVASIRFNAQRTCDLLHGLIDNLTFAREHKLDILFENTVQRLEYEYKHIFYKNVFPDGLGIVKLLIEANQIIGDQKGKPDYVIKPLRGLLKNMCQYERRLLERIEAEREIVLYGAGQFGQAFFQYLKRSHVSEKVAAFVVSDRKDNGSRIGGVPVITLQELQKKEEKLIFVTVREDIQGEIARYLEENGYKNYELVEDDFFCRIAEE